MAANSPRVGLPAWGEGVEVWYLRAYLVLAAVVYFRWAVLVINSICDYLGINCLTIGEKVAPGQVRGGKDGGGQSAERGGLSVEKRVVNGGVVRKGD